MRAGQLNQHGETWLEWYIAMLPWQGKGKGNGTTIVGVGMLKMLWSQGLSVVEAEEYIRSHYCVAPARRYAVTEAGVKRAIRDAVTGALNRLEAHRVDPQAQKVIDRWRELIKERHL